MNIRHFQSIYGYKLRTIVKIEHENEKQFRHATTSAAAAATKIKEKFVWMLCDSIAMLEHNKCDMRKKNKIKYITGATLSFHSIRS